MYKKVCKKCWQKRFEVIIYTSFQRERNSESEKSQESLKEKDFKKILKNFQKSIDKEKRVWYTLWAVLERGVANGPWKLNNEIRKGTRDSMVKIPSRRVFKSTFQTVIRKLK